MEVLDLRLLDCRSCYAVGGLILQKRHSRHRRTSNQTCCQGWSSVVWAQEGHALIVFSTRRSLVVGLATWFYLVGVFAPTEVDTGSGLRHLGLFVDLDCRKILAVWCIQGNMKNDY